MGCCESKMAVWRIRAHLKQKGEWSDRQKLHLVSLREINGSWDRYDSSDYDTDTDTDGGGDDDDDIRL